MKITLFGKEIKVPKKESVIVSFRVCGFNIYFRLIQDNQDNIDVIAINVRFNGEFDYNFNFTREFLRDSAEAELIILKSIFNAKTSYEILKQLHP